MKTEAKPVPVLDLTPEIDAVWPELQAAIERVIRTAQFIGGPEVSGLEDECAAYLGTKHAIGCNSGTDSLVIGLRALGVEEGDEVITTPFTFFASPESIGIIGATEVFVDVELGSFNIDPTGIEAAITPRTKALMPVHLFGRPANMDAITEISDRHGIAVIEDCAQSFGSRFGPGSRFEGRQTGSVGGVGAFSFFPSKNLGGFGDGGLMITDDDGVAELARKLRAHGGKHKYHNEMLGYNSRLDALQAALLRVKLPHLDARNEGRRAAALRYGELLADVDGVITPEVVPGHVFHQYTIRVLDDQRDGVYKALQAESIGCMIYYPIPCHRLPVYLDRGIEMPVTDILAGEVLSLPIWPTIEPEVQHRIRNVIANELGQ